MTLEENPKIDMKTKKISYNLSDYLRKFCVKMVHQGAPRSSFAPACLVKVGWMPDIPISHMGFAWKQVCTVTLCKMSDLPPSIFFLIARSLFLSTDHLSIALLVIPVTLKGSR
jgi:hypothetical protein